MYGGMSKAVAFALRQAPNTHNISCKNYLCLCSRYFRRAICFLRIVHAAPAQRNLGRPYPEGTPDAPGLDRLTYTGANDIERILALCEELIDNITKAFRHTGAAECAAGGLLT